MRTGKLVCWTLISLCLSWIPSWAGCHPLPPSQPYSECAPGWGPSYLQDTAPLSQKNQGPTKSVYQDFLSFKPYRSEFTFPDVISSVGRRTSSHVWLHMESQGTFQILPLDDGIPTASWDFSMPVGQEPASTLVLPTALPKSWVLLLLTLQNSKESPEIIPVLPDVSSSAFYTQSLAVSPFYSPKIISSIKTLKNVFTEFIYLLTWDCPSTGHKKGTWKLGRGVKG